MPEAAWQDLVGHVSGGYARRVFLRLLSTGWRVVPAEAPLEGEQHGAEAIAARLASSGAGAQILADDPARREQMEALLRVAFRRGVRSVAGVAEGAAVALRLDLEAAEAAAGVLEAASERAAAMARDLGLGNGRGAEMDARARRLAQAAVAMVALRSGGAVMAQDGPAGPAPAAPAAPAAELRPPAPAPAPAAPSGPAGPSGPAPAARRPSRGGPGLRRPPRAAPPAAGAAGAPA